MVVAKYRVTYDSEYLNYFLKVLWRAPSFRDAVLVGAVFKWLLYGIVVGTATAVLAPFLAIYGLRITDKNK